MYFLHTYFLISIGFTLFLGIHGKYVEGELQTSKDWDFITRFCFLSAKGTLKFRFEYPITYGPTNVLLYFDTADQWDSVYKSDKSCIDREAVLDISKNQIINLTTNFGLSGCQINSNGMYECIGGRIFRSTRERWWFVAVSRCSPDPTDTCSEKVSVLDPDNNQIIFLTTAYSVSGCVIQNIDGVDKYVCIGGRTFRSARERWWFVAVSRCNADPSSNCTERLAVLKPENNQQIRLLPGYDSSGCTVNTTPNGDVYICENSRIFRSARERWWYIAISHCLPQTPIGLNLKYEIHMTNGKEGDFLHREYSADEFYIFPIDLVFLGLYVLLCILTIICAVFLRNRQLWHTTYKMFMVSIFLWTFYLFLHSLAYGIYGNDGLEWKLRATKYAARAFEAISIMVFLLMLILVGKGYTITRGKLSMSSTVKISVFMTVYTVTYIVIFIWEALMFDPGLVLYIYESPPGYCLIALRLIGFLWFCYSIFFTLKHYPEKGSFYYPLFVFYTLWFWAGPLVVIIAMFAIALWSREKTVIGVEHFVALCGHVFFLILTRPSAANKNFPYHVRTTQIGIIQNAPHEGVEGQDGNGDGSFSNHAYAVSSPMPSSSSGPDLTSLFVTSKTRSDEKETSLNGDVKYNNGHVPPPAYNNPFVTSHTTSSSSAPRGRMNSSAHLMAEAEEYDMAEVNYPPLPVEASAPPSYAALFRANSNPQGDDDEKSYPQ